MTAPRLPVSVCLIAGNEAPRIRRTLDSVAGWASEIVLVLNEDVADGTDRIAEEYGAKIFREPWKGFVAQKNSAAAKCSQPWVLNLDADEEVTPGLRAEIERALAGPGDHAAFCFRRCSNYFGRWIRHGEGYPDWKTRLWRAGRARWAGASVHERLEVDGPVGRLPADLMHHTADSIDQLIKKMSGYTDVFARDLVEQQRPVGWFDLLVRPAWRFFRCYFLRRGFLDGWQGAYIAWFTAFYTVTRYAKAKAAQSAPPAGAAAEKQASK
jgi:glycosyltransferase involved in cell wall biosynthesis